MINENGHLHPPFPLIRLWAIHKPQIAFFAALHRRYTCEEGEDGKKDELVLVEGFRRAHKQGRAVSQKDERECGAKDGDLGEDGAGGDVAQERRRVLSCHPSHAELA